MMKCATIFSILFLLSSTFLRSQDLDKKISKELSKLEKDPQFTHAFLGMDVLDAKTGKSLFSYNAQKSLLPASTQKILTASALLEKYGPDYRIKTDFSLGVYDNNRNILFIRGNFDPSMGSNRWTNTSAKIIISEILSALEKKGIQKIDSIIFNNDVSGFSLPRGWIWEDIGNYYGAAAERFNWRENNFDIHLQSQTEAGSQVGIVSHNGPDDLVLYSFLTAGTKGSGDNAYVFHAPNDSFAFIRGTIPAGEKDFRISASASGAALFMSDLRKASNIFSNSGFGYTQTLPPGSNILFTHESPPLDSLVYWFLNKSINLYGESFIGLLSEGNYEKGLDSLYAVSHSLGINTEGMNLLDGSGLSPLNRISPATLATALFIATKKKWGNGLFGALPLINGIRMKDGYMTGYRSFAVIIKNNEGREMIFCLMANNYAGNPSAARQKLWNLLNVLK